MTREAKSCLSFGDVQHEASIPEIVNCVVQMGQGVANAVILIGVGLKQALRFDSLNK